MMKLHINYINASGVRVTRVTSHMFSKYVGHELPSVSLSALASAVCKNTPKVDISTSGPLFLFHRMEGGTTHLITVVLP